MKNRSFLFILLLLTGSTQIMAQYNNERVKKMKISDISIIGGAYLPGNKERSLLDLKSLAPTTTVPLGTKTGMSQIDAAGATEAASYSMLLGFQFANKDRTGYRANPQLRLGLTYFSTEKIYGSTFEIQKNTFDTLYIPAASATVYQDSVTSTYSNISNRSENLRLDLSIIFRTNPLARFFLFTGAGLTGGLSFNSATSASYSKNTYTEKRFLADSKTLSYLYDQENGKLEEINESFKNKNSLGFSAYLPIGIDFRIGRKNKLFKRLHIFYELRPSLNFTSIPELNETYTATAIQHGIGIKYSL